MEATSPTHSAVWAHVLLKDLTKRGIPERELLKGLGLARSQRDDPNERWPFDKIANLFEKASALTGDDLIGFHLAQSPDLVRKAGLLAYVGVSAPTVGGYLRNITQFQRVIGDASEVILQEGPETVRFEWHYDISAAVPTGQYAEFGAIGTVFALRDYSQRQIRPMRVQFAHHRSAKIDVFSRFFSCDAEFGASENCIHFKTTDMAVPLLTADDNLLQMLKGICESTLAQMPEAPNSVTRLVEREVTARLSSGTAQHEAIAGELGMSSRTLTRRLSDEGTNFATVVVDLRKALARDYLRNSTLPLTEISFLLGYGDASSFSTAFRRWNGETPSEYREQPGAPLD